MILFRSKHAPACCQVQLFSSPGFLWQTLWRWLIIVSLYIPNFAFLPVKKKWKRCVQLKAHNAYYTCKYPQRMKDEKEEKRKNHRKNLATDNGKSMVNKLSSLITANCSRWSNLTFFFPQITRNIHSLIIITVQKRRSPQNKMTGVMDSL